MLFPYQMQFIRWKTALLMFRAIGKFFGLFRRWRAPNVFDSRVTIDNMETAGFALQIGAFEEVHRISRKEVEPESSEEVCSRGIGVASITGSRTSEISNNYCQTF